MKQLAARIDWLFHRPAEELYDLESDPYEMHNRADDPQLADIKTRLGSQLDAWMAQQGDKGLDTELVATSRQGPARQKKAAKSSSDSAKKRRRKKSSWQRRSMAYARRVRARPPEHAGMWRKSLT